LLDPNDLHLPGLTPSSNSVASSSVSVGPGSANFPGGADLVGGDSPGGGFSDSSASGNTSLKTMEERRKQRMKEAAMKAAAAAAEAAVEAAFGGSGGPGPTGVVLDVSSMYNTMNLEDSQPQPSVRKKIRMNKKNDSCGCSSSYCSSR